MGDCIDDLTDYFDEFEAELDEVIESGRAQLRELTPDLRARFEALREEEPEPELSRLQSLRACLEELSDAVESKLERAVRDA